MTLRQLNPLAHLKLLGNLLGWYLGGLYRKVDQHHIFLLAGGLAFSLFACIIPLLFIVFAILGMVFEALPVATEIGSVVDRLIPYPDYAEKIKEILISRVDEFRVHKTLAGVIGFVGLLFASSGLFSSMRTILNMIFHVATTRSVIIGKLRDVGLVLLVLLYFLLTTTVLPALGIAEDFTEKVEFLRAYRLGFLADIAWGVVSILIIFGAFYTMYYLVPQTKLRKRVIGVSAVSATILWVVAEHLFGLYITHAATLKRVYGAFALLIIVAFWIFYTSIVFILGAEIGQLYRERKTKAPPAPRVKNA